MSRKRKRPDAPPSEHDIATEGLPSASGFDAELRCPGKRALCARLPKEDDTAYTESGRRIHHALETNDFSALTDTEARTASRIAYGESQIVQEFGFEGAHVTFEQRIWDVDDELNHLWSAQIDRYDWQPDKRRLLVLDDKSGWTIPPPVHENWQVRSEAALLAEQLDAEEVIVGLIHPRHPDTLWETRVYNRRSCADLLDIVRHGVAMIQKPDQRRIPGGIQCQWCTAKSVCPEFIAQGDNLAAKIKDEILDEGNTAINARTREERGVHVSQIKLQIKHLTEILKRYTKLLIRDPDAIAGYKLGRMLRRYVINEAEAMELVRAEFGTDALYASIKFSVSALEEELAKTKGMKEAKAAVERVLNPVLRNKRTEPFLQEARSL